MVGTTTWIRPLAEAGDDLPAHWEVSGSACRTTQGLFAAWAGALRFPDYFGHNWAAFNDCLRDALSGVGTTGGASGPATLVVREAGGLLADEPAKALGILLSVLADHADLAGAGGGPALLLLLDDEPEPLLDLGRRLAAVGWETSIPGSGA
ncbi:barstar family protein [Kitasatospora misakiensis]|uniref:Barstar family protein n=1 Tax=Kitasatospora misakiensis TaxID=67330 RepID=A0ABW0WTS3_9ACTN